MKKGRILILVAVAFLGSAWLSACRRPEDGHADRGQGRQPITESSDEAARERGGESGRRPGVKSAEKETDEARLAWWREARFGMFIHWGPVSLKGTEIGWSRGAEVPVEEYDELYKRFDPTLFDAEAWVRTAKRAGMKYLVITSKHHDGFAIWDTKLTDYNIMHTPFRRDVLKELSEACRREGIVFCTYHSILDWHHPDYPLGSPGGKTAKPSPDMDRYVDYLKGQVAELIRDYGPLGVMWFDGQWEKPWNPGRGRDLYEWVRSLQPSIIVNNRIGSAREPAHDRRQSSRYSVSAADHRQA